MRTFRLLGLLPLLAVAFVSPGEAKNGNGKAKGHYKQEWKNKTDRGYDRYTDGDWRRRTTDRDWNDDHRYRGRDRYGYYGNQRDGRHRGMDRNNDGYITRGEWRGNDTSFRNMDRNGDGVISAADRNGEGYRGRRDDYYNNDDWRYRRDRRYGRGDRNGDGVISHDEWSRDRDSFYRLDRNRDGVLTRDELNWR